MTGEHLDVTFFNSTIVGQHPFVYRYDLDAIRAHRQRRDLIPLESTDAP